MTKAKQAQTDESRAILCKLLPPGSKVYTLVTHVARSGMSRRFRVYRLSRTGVANITRHVARVLGYPLRDDGRWEMRVDGCGMDMGFHVVNSLSYALHGHAHKGADATKAQGLGSPFAPRRGHFRAGYSLTQEAL